MPSHVLAKSARTPLPWAARVVLFLCVLAAALTGAAGAASAETRTWNHVVDEMAVVIEDAGAAYRGGDAVAAKALVNDAYFGYYEKLGFEKTVMAYISGDRAAAVEYQFSEVKKDISAAASADQVDADLAELVSMLREDAKRLDGTEQAPFAVLLQALLIILREGFEAIIVVGAIIAYLVKAGHRDKTRAVYLGSAAALVASALLAWLLNSLTVLSGANQEIIEGVTVLTAVVMLVYVSSWILSKAENDAWSSYVERKSDESIKQGNVVTLALVAFLAVFREGAEVILFYQALIARSPAGISEVWLGLGIGAVLLAIAYLLIRLLSVRIPLRPFFLGTSLLLAVMAFSFAGSGIKELQEGGVVSATPVGWIGSVDVLGIYPTAETLALQLVVAVLLVVLFWLGFRKGRRNTPDVPPAVAIPAAALSEPTTLDSEQQLTTSQPTNRRSE